jgi:hypothetical protein
MKQCKAPGCGSYALNDAPESGLCDPCYWAELACKSMDKVASLKFEIEEWVSRVDDAEEVVTLREAELTRLKTIIRRNTGVDLEGGK